MKTLDCKTTLWYVIYYDLLTLFRFDTLTNEYKSEFHREILLETFNHVFKSSFDMSRIMVQLYDSFQPRIQALYSTQTRTQALYSTLLPRLRKDPGSGWSRVSQILGDYKKIHKGGWLSLFCQSCLSK